MTARLGRGEELPRIETPPPGPRSRELAALIGGGEAPVVNTLYGGEPSIVWAEALGSNLLDVDGNRYIDLTAGFGVAAVGHRHPRIVAAVVEQAGRLLHGLADVASHPARIELARRLAALAPVEDGKVHFAASGSDAVEVALKTAWLATGRRTIVTFDPAYHGTTLGALALTSRPAFRDPFTEHLTPHVRRLPHGAPLEGLDATLAECQPAAVVVEPIVGREGVVMPPPGWLEGLAESCRRQGALLVADEIFTGLGRTGEPFVCAAEGVAPDLLCCGKALGGGLPIAAVVGRGELMASWDRGGEALHTSTFLAHPLACAAALETLDLLDEENLAGRATRLGALVDSFASAWRELRGVRRVTGRGLLWTVELETDAAAADLARRAVARGLMILSSGRRLQVVPPLVISERQLHHALDELEELLGGD